MRWSRWDHESASGWTCADLRHHPASIWRSGCCRNKAIFNSFFGIASDEATDCDSRSQLLSAFTAFCQLTSAKRLPSASPGHVRTLKNIFLGTGSCRRCTRTYRVHRNPWGCPCNVRVANTSRGRTGNGKKNIISKIMVTKAKMKKTCRPQKRKSDQLVS